MMISRQISSFLAKSSSGELHTVIELQEYDSILTGAGTISETPSFKKWKTSAGYFLKPIDSEEYRIIDTDEVIRKI